MDSEPELESLMLEYQRGDLAAASSLVHRLSPQLHRFFGFQGTSRREADDLLQETWLGVHEARHTYRPGAAVLPWVYAIARHIRVDHFRRTLRHNSKTQTFVRESAAAAQTGQPSVEHPDLEALLAELPDSQREVIAMLKVAGMSLEEVARATGSSVGSVKQKAHRAYEKLRKQFERLRKGSISGGADR
jgi:RNA polymerase sigma-70 factor (ECF subfamily)